MPANAWTCPSGTDHTVVNHVALGWPQCVTCGAAPGLDERAMYATDVTLIVYAPNPGSALEDAAPKGSAIVSLPPFGSHVTVYFSPETDADYRANLEAAARLLVTATPTKTLARTPVDSLTRIGTYHTGTKELALADEPAAAAWNALALA